ncbi:hypothetical protein C9374_002622 [Naegleria lovaniensis]|uniref:Uncharacterized protein n=1 Tax=Naegleria lovaniensis TaxID=51637 RepID=A0AA88GPW1_NAELO|nr:uncharacterized protein C9374_002622 [Naegleria lovaniensis]KAG2386176.1 hypothetical protein C9374_002622 [Naegleria lovaniensis]
MIMKGMDRCRTGLGLIKEFLPTENQEMKQHLSHNKEYLLLFDTNPVVIGVVERGSYLKKKDGRVQTLFVGLSTLIKAICTCRRGLLEYVQMALIKVFETRNDIQLCTFKNINASKITTISSDMVQVRK